MTPALGGQVRRIASAIIEALLYDTGARLHIDLHSHSDRSDGALSPAAVVERAAANGVQVLALTDHDTVDGLAAASDAATRCNITMIAGVEISVTWNGRTLHVVGLGIDPVAKALVEGLARVRSGRDQRAHAIGQRLTQMGILGAHAGAMACARNPALIGRAHFARHLVATGVVKDMNAAFRRYLGDGRPANIKQTWASLEEASGWIRQAGGVAVLAHPGRYGLRAARLRELAAEFRRVGGSSLEVVTASHTPAQAADLARLASEHGLSASLGSDFHDPDQSWFDLGRFPSLPSQCKPIWEDPSTPIARAVH